MYVREEHSISVHVFDISTRIRFQYMYVRLRRADEQASTRKCSFIENNTHVQQLVTMIMVLNARKEHSAYQHTY
jgi:hypothetical protein